MLDVNDNAPRFRPFGVTNFTEKILEGAQPGTTLLSVSAVDPDKGPNGQVTYQLLNLPRGEYIRLEDPSTGAMKNLGKTLKRTKCLLINISVFEFSKFICHRCSAGKIVANKTVDFEQVQWLNFTIQARDQGSPPRSVELPVYLQIVDVNDNNPVFLQPSYQVPNQTSPGFLI